LEHEQSVLGGRHVFRVRLAFQGRAGNLLLHLTTYLALAIGAVASVAWFGFEGSFDYRYLLAPEVASQIYAVASSTGEMHVALDDNLLMSRSWALLLQRLRAILT